MSVFLNVLAIMLALAMLAFFVALFFVGAAIFYDEYGDSPLMKLIENLIEERADKND